MTDKKATLTAALEQRNAEIFTYQIDIENFARAITKVEAKYTEEDPIDVAMREFSEKLKGLLFNSQVEQLKAITIRDVIAEQLAEIKEQ